MLYRKINNSNKIKTRMLLSIWKNGYRVDPKA